MPNSESESQSVQGLAVPENLTYEYFEKNRYTISEHDGYQALCNNGFIKLFTIRTRVYWHAQNQFQHRVPDWKFHVSVQHEDLKKAWNLLVGLFLKMRCRAGMKVIYLKQAVDPQIGRQITIYIVKFSKEFHKSSFAKDYDVSIADEHSEDFWFQMAIQIENLLTSHDIKSNGLAPGDLKIGKYLSLRNQAFTLHEDGQYGYPKNQHGWNAQKQKIPLNISQLIRKLKDHQSTNQRDEQNQQKQRPMYYFALPIMLLSLGFYCYQKVKVGGH